SPAPSPAPDPRVLEELSGIKSEIDAFTSQMASFEDLFSAIESYKKGHYGAVPEAEFMQLWAIMERTGAMVPHEQFQQGRRDLLSAYHWLAQYLLSTDPSHQKMYLSNGNARLDAARSELRKFSAYLDNAAKRAGLKDSSVLTSNVSSGALSAPPETPAGKKLIAKKNQIEKLSRNIASFMDLVETIESYKAKNYGAIPQSEFGQLDSIVGTINAMVCDSQFQDGFRALKMALQDYRQYLIFTNPAQQKTFIDRARAQMSIARSALNKMKATYESQVKAAYGKEGE
ncbi:MAG: hypothetical protein RDV48_15000, partial [Candidatus Eremiobacteraeota bacterium]|nr:hypothetical protein [Candidatus Eremiobacteraeota bacterium]